MSKQICPINSEPCFICPEYSKHGLCDYPYKNSDKEIRAIKLWGHRIGSIRKYVTHGNN